MSQLNNAAQAQEQRTLALAKIRKLLALAGNEAASEQEAATAARHAESLMRQHQIDSIETTLDEIQKDDAFDRGYVDVSFEGRENYVSKSVPSWVGLIAVGVGSLHTCKVDTSWVQGRGVKIRFSGYAPDVLVATWTYTMLCETVFRLSKMHGKGMGMAFNKSFRMGAAIKLQQMMFEMSFARKQEAKQQSATSNALIVLDNKVARVEEMFGAQKLKSTSVSTSSRSGLEAGKAAASKINIASNAVGQTQTANKRLH
jgi:hypothetical protein